jgi:rhodanese-related sulfurtransferase
VSLRRHLLEAATLVLAAVLCAVVANALASRERKLALVGSYPNALKVPESAARPGPGPVSAPKAAVQTQGSEATNSSSSPADLLRRFPPHNKPFVEVSGDDVAWLFARGVLILDARRTKDYEQGHIALARSFPVWESDIDARATALVGEARDGAIPVVLYCSGGDCEDSHMLAQKLFGAGFNNLLVYQGGWPDWQKRGGRSATGPEP